VQAGSESHLAGKDTQTVVNALVRHARKLPQELYKSLTWDRGKEPAAHKRFTLATDIKVYFCDPQSPWQRGTNENTNGLLRQYLPKGLDIHLRLLAGQPGCHCAKIERASEEDSGLHDAS
jgi:IS30 family transposase